MNNATKICILTIVFISFIPIFLISGCTPERSTQQKIEVVKAQSYYSDFNIVDDSVLINCNITVQNSFDTTKRINLCAYFPDDKRGGLLVDDKLYSIDDNGEIVEYLILSNSQESFEVIFVGTYAGNNVKHDRNLPEIEVLILE